MIRLPSAGASAAARTLTGTIARSGRGSAPATAANRRSAPATTASTTSLSFAPRARFTRSSRASDTLSVTRARRDPISALTNDGAAGWITSSASESAARRIVSATRRLDRGRSPIAATRRAARNCSRAPSASASTAIRSGASTGSGSQSPGSGSAASGARSKSSVPSSTAAIPSTIAW